MAQLNDLIYGGTTRLNPRQLDVLSLYSIPNTLMQRGFEGVTESKIQKTLLVPQLDSRFDMSNRNEFKRHANNFLRMFSGKEFRKGIRKQIFGDCLDHLQGYKFPKTEENEKRYSATVELLMAFLCIEELKAFSAGFGVHVNGAPHGGDYDCIANFQGRLVSFELKSGNANNIEREDIEHFIERHDFLSPEVSILLIDYQGIENIVMRAKGLPLNRFSNVERIVSFEYEESKFYTLSPGVIIVDIIRNGDILRNIRGAMKFTDRFTTEIRRRSYETLQPSHLGCTGKDL